MPNRNGFGYKVHKIIADDISVPFVPDGYRFDEENKCLYLLEEVNTNDLTMKKLMDLACFWFDCDSEGWDVVLKVKHWYGAESEVRLGDAYYKYVLGGLRDGKI